jgi:hypothetical protein
MEGKTLHSACVNKARDTIHNETSCWTLEEIQRMSYDVHFLLVKQEKICCTQLLECELSPGQV